MKQSHILYTFLLVLKSNLIAQGPAPSPFKALASTQYTPHIELFAEFRPLLLNTPARFTAHLTKVGG